MMQLNHNSYNIISLIQKFTIYSSLIHKNVGADQSNNMLLKLEEDAEVAYNEYDKAVKAEDRAESYVQKVNFLSLKSIF